MKKTIKIIAVAVVCVIAACCSLSVLAGFNIYPTTRFEKGFCNDSKMLSWEKEFTVQGKDVVTKEFVFSDVKPLVIKPENGADDALHSEYRVMHDYSVSGSLSNAPWSLADEQYGKTPIYELDVKAGVDVIGTNAFYGRDDITTVNLDASLKTVREGAFAGCTGITVINFNGTKADWEALTIEQNNGILNNSFEQLKSAGILVVKSSIIGDVNSDNNVDKADAELLAQYISRKITASDLNLAVADVNGDGIVNVSDCVKIMLLTK